VKHPISGEPILFAPLRAERPHAFAGDAAIERCPFCPGHEADTPPEIVRNGEPWRVRVFPNKYPPAEGAEVIVESPVHDARFEDIAHLDEVLETYAARLAAHASAPYAALFRNDGARAGSSIPHVHAQLVPLPFVPPRVQREIDGFARACALCSIEGELIRENESFVWIAPHGSWMPYQQWIVPKRHIPSLQDADLDGLASMLRFASAATRSIGDFNVVFMNVPRGHFYVEILPRITTIAGLELGTGTFVEIVDPADAARRLRT
jgi:UDPglucose--hexose-1-phosphate uridylyltransferase